MSRARGLLLEIDNLMYKILTRPPLILVRFKPKVPQFECSFKLEFFFKFPRVSSKLESSVFE